MNFGRIFIRFKNFQNATCLKALWNDIVQYLDNDSLKKIMYMVAIQSLKLHNDDLKYSDHLFHAYKVIMFRYCM